MSDKYGDMEYNEIEHLLYIVLGYNNDENKTFIDNMKNDDLHEKIDDLENLILSFSSYYNQIYEEDLINEKDLRVIDYYDKARKFIDNYYNTLEKEINSISGVSDKIKKEFDFIKHILSEDEDYKKNIKKIDEFLDNMDHAKTFKILKEKFQEYDKDFEEIKTKDYYFYRRDFDIKYKKIFKGIGNIKKLFELWKEKDNSINLPNIGDIDKKLETIIKAKEYGDNKTQELEEEQEKIINYMKSEIDSNIDKSNILLRGSEDESYKLYKEDKLFCEMLNNYIGNLADLIIFYEDIWKPVIKIHLDLCLLIVGIKEKGDKKKGMKKDEEKKDKKKDKNKGKNKDDENHDDKIQKNKDDDKIQKNKDDDEIQKNKDDDEIQKNKDDENQKKDKGDENQKKDKGDENQKKDKGDENQKKDKGGENQKKKEEESKNSEERKKNEGESKEGDEKYGWIMCRGKYGYIMCSIYVLIFLIIIFSVYFIFFRKRKNKTFNR